MPNTSNNPAEVESKITLLENEVAIALYSLPSPKDEKARQTWLQHLEWIKEEKDANSPIWHRLQRWDWW